MQIQIKDNVDYKRDMYSKAVINNNKAALETCKINRQKRIENDARLSKLEKEFGEVKDSIAQILTLLKN